MLAHVCAGRWLRKADVAESYDRVAAGYDENWLVYLREVTDALLEQLPQSCGGRILDLGCGTGYTSVALAKKYAECELVAVDISAEMLAQAQGKCESAEFVEADCLEFLGRQADGSAGLIVSAWAIGYSNPEQMMRECARVLTADGSLLFVVNYADTLQPVFSAFRKSMARFPDKVQKALWPKFPRNRLQVEEQMGAAGFSLAFVKEGEVEVRPPEGRDSELDWLLRTGVLAGFDCVLPLLEDGELAKFFEEELKRSPEPLAHHYIAVKGVKK